MMLRTLINLFLFALLFAISGLSSQLYADTLSQIQDREVIRIGVKVDYPPWGMLSPEGDIVGFEPDLAALVAKELGVKVKLRSVTSGNRFQLLEEGEVHRKQKHTKKNESVCEKNKHKAKCKGRVNREK